MKLNPEELEVTSFDTAAQEAAAIDAAYRPIAPTPYPTPRTYCFVCDPATYNCA